LARQPIDYPQACRQHQAYRNFLRRCGAEVITLGANTYPDSVFVEDSALVLDEVAVVTSMGIRSRQGENPEVGTLLSKYRPIREIYPPATLEGGDILKIGDRLYVGQSPRTNAAGIQQLRQITRSYGYRVIGIPIKDCLHLKSACIALDEHSLFINPDWVDTALFHDFKIYTVPEEEPWSVNLLSIDGCLCMSSSFPRAIEKMFGLGFKVEAIDNSEFLKAEAGLTCMSLIINT
jgi:dimethylargininase